MRQRDNPRRIFQFDLFLLTCARALRAYRRGAKGADPSP